MTMSSAPIPQVRVVRSAGQQFAPPPAPRARPGRVNEHLRTLVAVAFGMWPLTAVLLLLLGLLYYAGMNSSP